MDARAAADRGQGGEGVRENMDTQNSGAGKAQLLIDSLRIALAMRSRVPVVLQTEAAECGLACLAMVLGHFGVRTDLLALRQRHAVSMSGLSLGGAGDGGRGRASGLARAAAGGRRAGAAAPALHPALGPEPLRRAEGGRRPRRGHPRPRAGRAPGEPARAVGAFHRRGAGAVARRGLPAAQRAHPRHAAAADRPGARRRRDAGAAAGAVAGAGGVRAGASAVHPVGDRPGAAVARP